MWTPTARAELARESCPFAACLTNAKWAVVGAMLPGPPITGCLQGACNKHSTDHHLTKVNHP